MKGRLYLFLTPDGVTYSSCEEVIQMWRIFRFSDGLKVILKRKPLKNL